jgi:hypothetical protein
MMRCEFCGVMNCYGKQHKTTRLALATVISFAANKSKRYKAEGALDAPLL